MEPQIIQGGMGVAVSHWRLAHAVAQRGQLGVVSGTALAPVLVSRLQRGDLDGQMRRALRHFPLPAVARQIIDEYWVAGGLPAGSPSRLPPMYTFEPGYALEALTVAASFVEVFLAKEGHGGLVGMNLLEKIQLPTLPTLYGAMLAGVDYVLMGAGIPREIPAALDQLSRHEEATLKLDVEGASTNAGLRLRFSPARLVGQADRPSLLRPRFLAIVASDVLATTLARKSRGRVDGFVIEGPRAGGHNAPPRGPLQLDERGDPRYGPRDEVDYERIRSLGLPFWVAGGFGTAAKLKEARALGAAGVQVGTAFAFCRESGLPAETKRRMLQQARAGTGEVRTSARASPAGFPFKVLQWEASVSDASAYAARPRLCNLGLLRRPYQRPDGTLGYRCPAEPEEAYVAKGGRREDTEGRVCVCNGLFAAVGLPQVQKSGYVEPPLFTVGDDFNELGRLVPEGRESYSASDVIDSILGADR